MGFDGVRSKCLEGMRILRIGHHDPDYARNRIVAKALRRAGAEVVDIADHRRVARRLPALVRRGARERFDLVMVGFPGHADVAAARLLARHRRVPVVFDALVSLYEAAVEDRGTAQAGSIRARRYLLEDRWACRLADLVLLDTDAHVSYFRNELRLSRCTFSRLWVGADDDLVAPSAAEDDEVFRVFFYGSFIPLHGVEHVVEAARLLEKDGQTVEVTLVGDGQTYREAHRLAEGAGLRCLHFLGRLPYPALLGVMARSHACLGIFGTTPKARRVIPNKVFDALAMAKPVITADTPALREALVPERHVLACPAGDSVALAGAIVRVKEDRSLRERIAAEGHQRFKQSFSIDALSEQLGPRLRQLVDA